MLIDPTAASTIDHVTPTGQKSPLTTLSTGTENGRLKIALGPRERVWCRLCKCELYLKGVSKHLRRSTTHLRLIKGEGGAGAAVAGSAGPGTEEKLVVKKEDGRESEEDESVASEGLDSESITRTPLYLTEPDTPPRADSAISVDPGHVNGHDGLKPPPPLPLPPSVSVSVSSSMHTRNLSILKEAPPKAVSAKVIQSAGGTVTVGSSSSSSSSAAAAAAAANGAAVATATAMAMQNGKVEMIRTGGPTAVTVTRHSSSPAMVKSPTVPVHTLRVHTTSTSNTSNSNSNSDGDIPHPKRTHSLHDIPGHSSTAQPTRGTTHYSHSPPSRSAPPPELAEASRFPEEDLHGHAHHVHARHHRRSGVVDVTEHAHDAASTSAAAAATSATTGTTPAHAHDLASDAEERDGDVSVHSRHTQTDGGFMDAVIPPQALLMRKRTFSSDMNVGGAGHASTSNTCTTLPQPSHPQGTNHTSSSTSSTTGDPATAPPPKRPKLHPPPPDSRFTIHLAEYEITFETNICDGPGRRVDARAWVRARDGRCGVRWPVVLVRDR